MLNVSNRVLIYLLILFLCIVGFGMFKINIFINHGIEDYSRIVWVSSSVTLFIGAAVSIVIMIGIATLLWSFAEKDHSLKNWKTFFGYLDITLLILIINELLKFAYTILFLDNELSSYGILDVKGLKTIVPQSNWYRLTEISDFIFLLISVIVCCFQLVKLYKIPRLKIWFYYLLGIGIVIAARFYDSL